jgi:hypothetical protein
MPSNYNRTINISDTGDAGTFQRGQYIYNPTSSGSAPTPPINEPKATIKNIGLQFTITTNTPTEATQLPYVLRDIDEVNLMQDVSELNKRIIGQQDN